MFAGDSEAHSKAVAIAEYLSNYDLHMSHGRRVGVEDLRAKGVKIDYASAIDPRLDDLLSRVWIALELTLMGTATYKLFENHLGQGIFHQATMEIRQSPAA